MAFTGRSVGILYSGTQGDSLSGNFVIDWIRFNSGTGGAGSVCKLTETASTNVFFNGTSKESYGTVTQVFEGGQMFNGIIVGSLSAGHVQIGLR